MQLGEWGQGDKNVQLGSPCPHPAKAAVVVGSYTKTDTGRPRSWDGSSRHARPPLLLLTCHWKQALALAGSLSGFIRN